MESWLAIDWENIFAFQTPLLEIILRGSFIYLSLFIMLRVVLKREAGGMGITDLLVLVLLAEAAQNGLADDYRSIPDGLLLVATVVFWSYFLNWLGYRFPAMQRFVHPPPLLLVENGKMLHRNMRKEFITEDELMTMLREQGVEDVSEAKKVFMEGDGKISVTKNDKEQHQPPERKMV